MDQAKPPLSYIALIAMAIQDAPDHQLLLSGVYEWIHSHFPYFRGRGAGWRNSVRHNLSLNECFVKAGRSANGKGHYWRIHEACRDDFARGDFSRRRAQRKVRQWLGLWVEGESPLPAPRLPSHDLALLQLLLASPLSIPKKVPFTIESILNR